MICAKTVLLPPQEAATTAHSVGYTSCAVVQVDYRLSVLPCPHCDDNAPAIGQATRSAIDIHLEQPALLWVLVSVHLCEHCDRYFRAQPPFLREGAVYTRQVVTKAIASVYQDGMAYRRVADRLARDFWVRPSEASIRRWCRAYGESLDFLADYQPWVVESFSGVLCVDEVYQGQLALLLAVDPLRGDRLVGYQLLYGSVKQVEVEHFFFQLREAGIVPEEVVTDGSPLYPEALRQIWPSAAHQLCLFHASRAVTRTAQQALRALRATLPEAPSGNTMGLGGRRPKVTTSLRAQLARAARAQVHSLKSQGLALRAIARQTGFSRNAVRRW